MTDGIPDETAAQLRILEIASLPEEERTEIIVAIERLDVALQNICSSLYALTPFMKTVISEGAAKLKKDAVLIGSPLCDNCARKGDCSKKNEEVRTCPEYQERVPECSTCDFWDTVTCMGSTPCRGGDAHVPQKV